MAKKPELEYRGQPIKGHVVSLTGKTGGPEGHALDAADLDIGDEVSYIVTGVVTGLAHSHEEKLAGLLRKPKVTVSEMHRLVPGEADLLIVELRERDSRALDALLGRSALPFGEERKADPDTGVIDEGGE